MFAHDFLPLTDTNLASNAIQSQLSQQVPAGLDYEKFMAGLLSYKTYSKELIDASEADATPFLKDPDGPTCAQVLGGHGGGHSHRVY